MNKKVSKEEVKHIAHLARLDCTEKEVETFAGQISDILSYIQKLESVDTAAVEPTSQVVQLSNIFREDEVIGCDPDIKRRLLAEVPIFENGYVVVPHTL